MQHSKNEFNINLDSEVNKPNAATTIRTEAKPLNFYDADRYAFISIDPVIVGKLRLTRDDLFFQEIVGENILLRRRKDAI